MYPPKEVSDKEMLEIINKRAPLGKFWCVAPSAFTVCDNTTGDAWTEDFGLFDEAMLWLNEQRAVTPELELTSSNVKELFDKCMFVKDDVISKYYLGKGIITDVAFHPERLLENRQKICSLISQLPTEFNKEPGGGWSFLQMCLNKKGEQWCDLHQTMEQLVLLGTAIGKLEFPFPREIWKGLAGGMPYIAILEDCLPIEVLVATEEQISEAEKDTEPKLNIPRCLELFDEMVTEFEDDRTSENAGRIQTIILADGRKAEVHLVITTDEAKFLGDE